MLITVSISNKSFWVQTWKMLGEFAKKSDCSVNKTAKTNPDGTVSADIDPDLIPGLMRAIKDHNLSHEGRNTLEIILSEEEYFEAIKSAG